MSPDMNRPHLFAASANAAPLLLAVLEVPKKSPNKRKMEDAQKTEADREAAARRELGPQILADAERLIADWNERQAKQAPMLFSPTIGAVIAARHWFLWIRCPACHTTERDRSARARPSC